jgi:membrane protease YdiL (CAAX protease family)
MNKTNSRLPSTRDSKVLLIAELAIFAAIFTAFSLKLVPISKTPFLFALAWASLLVRGVKWKDVGLRIYRNWLLTLLLGVVAGAGMEGLELFVTQPILIDLTGQKPDFSNFAALKGNLKLLPVGVALAWGLAAFGEEMVFRGYLLNRLFDLFKPARESTFLALVCMAALFGFAHVNQGITGILDEGLMGLLLGLLYLGFGRSLAIPIIAHGVADTIDVTLLYIGHYPGVS